MLSPYNGVIEKHPCSDDANTRMFRNRETQPWEGVMAGVDDRRDQSKDNASHAGIENIKPGEQPYQDGGQLRSRVPREIVVLE